MEDAVDISLESSSNDDRGEINLRYEIPTVTRDELLTQKLFFGPDCTEVIESKYMTVTTTKLYDESTDEITPVSTMIDIVTSNISSSEMYAPSSDGNSADITFCIRTNFGVSTYFSTSTNTYIESSVNHSMIQFVVHIDLLAGIADISNVWKKGDDDMKIETNIHPHLQACECTPNEMRCIPAGVYRNDDIMTICVDSHGEGVITNFHNVNIIQANTGITTNVISTDGIISSIAGVGALGNSRAFVSSRLITAFFLNGDGIISMSGNVVMGFSGRRRLGSLDGKSSTHQDKRYLQELGKGSFNVAVVLSNDIETTLSDNALPSSAIGISAHFSLPIFTIGIGVFNSI